MSRWLFDIGHGKNTWPPSKGVYLAGGGSFAEFDFNYAVAMAAYKLAIYNGHEIVFSQESYDKDISVTKRVQERIKPLHKVEPFDGLLSFHANASNNKKATGHGVLHWHNSSASKKLAQIWDKYADIYLDIPNWGTNGIWESKRNHWSTIYMLWATPMPAVTLEHFFFTNPDELEHCDTELFVQRCAEVAVRTMCEFMDMSFRHLPAEETEGEAAVTANNYLAAIEAAITSADSSDTLSENEITKYLLDRVYYRCIRKDLRA